MLGIHVYQNTGILKVFILLQSSQNELLQTQVRYYFRYRRYSLPALKYQFYPNHKLRSNFINHFSFSQTVAMSRGSGRGYSSPRGGMSFRGNSGRGSSWNDRGSSRGYSSNRGGRFSSSWHSNNSSSFDSRSRYNSSSGGGGERYASNSRRPDEGSYKRSYRSVSYIFS